jgi:dephospho-CoA kinase
LLLIGLTGGIASGKTTVAGMFAELGAGIIDTDGIARELVVPGTPALAEIVAAFGQGVLTDDGTLDRRRLRRLVFADEKQRRTLEKILHPRIRREALARAEASTAAYVILVVPLLFETGFDALIDRSLMVDCPEAVQLERLMQRDGVDRAEAEAAIAAQMGRDERRSRADDIVDSNTDLEATAARVGELHRQYVELAKNCSEAEARAE